MTYLANHVHGFFNVIDFDKSGDITFEEFLASVLPRCPFSQIKDFVRRLSPELDIEGKRYDKITRIYQNRSSELIALPDI